MLKTDEEQALKLLYDTYYESLLLYARSITGDAESAGDVVQDCFVNFWLGKRLSNLPDGLEKYIFQSVKHTALNYNRGKQRRQQLYEKVVKEIPEAVPMPVGDDEAEDLAVIFAAINRLPAERRKIFLMVCVEGLSYQAVADSLNISKNTVKTQMSRSVRFLREQLKNHTFSSIMLLLMKKK